ncbi:MAG: DUF2141 domain-containing protein [Polyangiales bacterium]
MTRWSSALCLLLGLSALALVPVRAAAQATVTVSVSGFKGVEGVALVTLYDNEQSWLKVPKAVQVVRAKITGDALTVEFKEVKPGTYAVSVIHDENKNNELDMRWLPYPKPKEGVGVSNDPEQKAGPPKWEGAKFSVASGAVKIKATVRYPQ